MLTSAYENGRLKGHLLGLLDLAQELVSRGHRVLVERFFHLAHRVLKLEYGKSVSAAQERGSAVA